MIEQYQGVFSNKAIDAHLNEYIGSSHTNYLIEKITPHVSKGMKILDIGSGYGGFVLAAIQYGYNCQGIEIAEFDCQISKERALDQNIDDKVFTQGSALNLPYEDSFFDVVTFWNVLEHIDDYKTAIKEARRVLKPGGKMLIIAPNYFTFRKEAHYHVPWLPIFPKSLARIYLRLLNKKTHFLDESIFYITMFGLKKFLKSLDMDIRIDTNEKIDMVWSFQSDNINFLIKIIKKLKMLNFLKSSLFLVKTHPLIHSIDIMAYKND